MFCLLRFVARAVKRIQNKSKALAWSGWRHWLARHLDNRAKLTSHLRKIMSALFMKSWNAWRWFVKVGACSPLPDVLSLSPPKHSHRPASRFLVTAEALLVT